MDKKGSSPSGGFHRFARRVGVTVAWLGVVYAALFLLNRAFPYYGEGGRVVTSVKIGHFSTHPVFRNDAERRVVLFGNSKVLSGFIPDLFDELSGGRVESYNLGLPQAERVVPYLEALIEAGNIPTDILLTLPWAEPPPGNPLVFIQDDEAVLKRLAPFRHIARDAAIFLNRARFRGGPAALYEETRRDSEAILTNRGYYFIAGQSKFPDARLPASFQLESDQPESTKPRTLPRRGRVYKRLVGLMETHDIRAWFVPTYYRVTQYRPVEDEPNPALVAAMADNPRFQVLGPDYESYPNALFSDRLHVNPEGAQIYTTRVWELFEEAMGPALP